MRQYKTFAKDLRERFNCRVYKISVDAGMPCPNLDGTLSTMGCIYCDNRSFSPNAGTSKPLEQQIADGIRYGKSRFNADRFIIYFQPYTNTNLPPEQLKKVYGIIERFPEASGIAIGTRPDFIDEEKLDIIEAFSKRFEVWIEYGLQTMHDNTLELINRNHTYRDFMKAYLMTRKRSVRICLHAIIGLPGESRQQIIATADECGRIKPDAIKINPLYIVKGTPLEEMFRENRYAPLSFRDYIETAAEFISRLSPETVIQRMAANCPPDMLVAPGWINRRQDIVDGIKLELRKKQINVD